MGNIYTTLCFFDVATLWKVGNASALQQIVPCLTTAGNQGSFCTSVWGRSGGVEVTECDLDSIFLFLFGMSDWPVLTFLVIN